MELRMYRYRLYPSRVQQSRLFSTFDICKQTYNELLALSIDAWKFGKVSLGKFDFNSLLKGRNAVFSQVYQNISDRLHKAMQNFFRRAKDPKCRKKGFPRFKSRVQSITYPQAINKGQRTGFWFLNNKRLHCSKIGNIPIKLHRVPKGKIKTLTIKRNNAGQWFATFACEVDIPKAKHPSNKSVGIDVGLESFATLSDGSRFDNPRFLLRSEKRLKFLQRRLSRKVKGSANRRKARFRVAKQHVKIANQRSDWLHKLSHTLTKQYSRIAVESLNIKNMIHNHSLAKHIDDASWQSFIRMLSYKAVTSGGQLVEVNARDTSKTCNRCGAIREMELSERQFVCSECGFVCHRDLNASLNIYGRAGLAQTLTPVETCSSTAEQSAASAVCEAGTINGK